MAYSSEVNIRLGEVPKTTDPELFPDVVDIYNAIHILNQYTNSIGKYIRDKEGEPSFQTVKVTATREIKAGSVVTVVNSFIYLEGGPGITPGLQRVSGTYLGHGFRGSTLRQVIIPDREYGYTTSTEYQDVFNKWTEGVSSSDFPTPPFTGIIIGIATSDAQEGEEVTIGFGTQILKIDGVTLGQPIMCNAAFTSPTITVPPSAFNPFPRYTYVGDGSLYRYSVPPRGFVTPAYKFIGVGLRDDEALITIGGVFINPDDFKSVSRR